MKRVIEQISQVLSLRTPQREGLERLDQLLQGLTLAKEANPREALKGVQSVDPTFEDFEREFPSLCFALATGVGKTRLMGAFIAYLHRVKGIHHFMVLAPNLTIYNKLIQDFTPNTPKYVLKGLPQFTAQPPEIITGENFENGHGIRNEFAAQRDFFEQGQIHINIFNIAKINKGEEGLRIKRLSEYLGVSYFEYLSELSDLVLLMDESHRYRASAGVRVINELKPVLGLELTATPYTEGRSSKEPIYFKNRAYHYPLSKAIDDGFVKIPAVGGRTDFNADDYSEADLELIKLKDGICIHEETKLHLHNYAHEADRDVVKPFVLVIAEDTTHADHLLRLIESDSFFGGEYRNKVLVVHSKLRGEEEDLTVNQLLSVEAPDNPIEIVIHVNMLKEGWDVKNLYTIIPLRAANARTLLEQSIGRGLRLPYGARTGNAYVDRLTIVSHDRFNEIVEEANKPNSLIKQGVLIGRDFSAQRQGVVEVKSSIGSRFTNDQDRQIASTILRHIQESGNGLNAMDESSERFESAVQLIQTEMGEAVSRDQIVPIIRQVRQECLAYSIDIPRVRLQPTEGSQGSYAEFDLTDLESIRLQPVSQEILIKHLAGDGAQERLQAVSDSQQDEEPYVENYLVRRLVEFDEISYDLHKELLFKLAKQVVDHLSTYLATADDVVQVVRGYQEELARFIRRQMEDHFQEPEVHFESEVRQGSIALKSRKYLISEGEEPVDFRKAIDEKRLIKGALFQGFKKVQFPIQRFDSNSEKEFAMLLESDPSVLKWLKPVREDLRIYYRADRVYEPDFIIETTDHKYVCEIKRACDMEDPMVLAKARAASRWCQLASDNAQQCAGKPWSYLLIPHDEVTSCRTLQGLAAAWTFREVNQ